MPPEPHPHPWYDRQHHTPGGGFQNLDPSMQAASFSEVAPWLLRRAFRSASHASPPVCAADVEALRSPPPSLRVTWIGHATLLLQWPGGTVLTDPIFSARASPLPFAGPARIPARPLAIDELPSVDVVLLSHNHYDHLDAPSVRALRARFDPLFLAPLGVDAHLRGWGVERVVAADWWQYVDVDGWRFHCTPAQHFSARSLFDRNATLWAGWYVEPRGDATAPRLFFAGDTAYADHFATCRTRLGAPDVACLPIGAYRPRRIMRPVHMNPEEAVQAFFDLGAAHFVPIHWGTFALTDEPLDEPPARLCARAARHALTDRVHVLDVGASVELAARTTD